MKLTIKNIGMLESACVKLGGLTVIAGENDTGKSTVGKLLFATVKADNICRMSKKNTKPPKEVMATWLNLVFDGNVSSDGYMSLENNSRKFLEVGIKDRNFVATYDPVSSKDEKSPFFDVTFVQSPIVFDMIDFFDGITRLKEMQRMQQAERYGVDFDFSYPVIFWDLYNKISRKNPFPKATHHTNIAEAIQNVIGGEFKRDGNRLAFNKYLQGRAIKTEIANTAFGIKSFGLLQLLNENDYLNKKYLLILDEPEVHLHPHWQLEYAKVIVNLAEYGIFVLVNTHSPYMLQALKTYSDKNQAVSNKTSFYLAERSSDDSSSNILDKTNELNDIFIKLAEPLREIV